MRVTLRPSEPGDFIAVNGRLPPYRVRGLTAMRGEEILGVGGFVLLPNGAVWASVAMCPAARRFPVAIHRAGRAAMRLARDLGFTCVYAEADGDLAGAGRWLESLGFQRERGEVFAWRPQRS